jgi:hypothetical protein
MHSRSTLGSYLILALLDLIVIVVVSISTLI